MLAAVGASGLAYSAVEAHRYRLRRLSVPVLPVGQPNLRVLHVSDMHLTPRHRGRVAWVRSLAQLRPDAVVVTGDFLAHRQAVPAALEALDPLLALPGAFVLGSNDYLEPAPVRPWLYLAGPSTVAQHRAALPWGDLVAGLTDAGWLDLSNRRGRLSVAGREVEAARGRRPAHRTGPVRPGRRAVRPGRRPRPRRRRTRPTSGSSTRWPATAAGLVLAGHTHGGQLCLPGIGALITNCDLAPAQAKGLSRHARPGSDADPGLGGVDGRGTLLHVSAGAGDLARTRRCGSPAPRRPRC